MTASVDITVAVLFNIIVCNVTVLLVVVGCQSHMMYLFPVNSMHDKKCSAKMPTQ